MKLLTVILLAFLGFTFSADAQHPREICVRYCDGTDPGQIDSLTLRAAVSNASEVPWVITLHITDEENMGLATIEGGQPGDMVWLDRSFDGGLSWEPDGGHLGDAEIPNGATNVSTALFNIDDPANRGLGALRVCARPVSLGRGICTEWARSMVLATNPTEAVATALMQYFDGKLWHTIGWWNSANALTALIDYMEVTGTRDFLWLVDHVFVENLDGWDGNYTSDALDDTEWWALAWVQAYDLTGDRKYLDMAIFDADYIYQYVDDVCGGGVWWNIYRTYKNAITNELYIQLAAALHNRIPGDTKYLAQAESLWRWFRGSGMINADFLINDGLTDDCRSNNDTTWTYNQGVVLGALAELFTATNKFEYLLDAINIATAVVNSPQLSPNGILREPCEVWTGPPSCGPAPDGCDCNQISFKGIFMRNLAKLNRLSPNGMGFTEYIKRQRDSNYQYNRNPLNQYGVHYAGPFNDLNGGTIQSALEAFTAAWP